MPMLKPNTLLPTDEEEAAINAGIAADSDTYELSDAEFLQLKPYQTKSSQIATPKERISLDLSSDVLAAFRATGNDWQTRMNNALEEWLREHAL